MPQYTWWCMRSTGGGVVDGSARCMSWNARNTGAPSFAYASSRGCTTMRLQTAAAVPPITAARVPASDSAMTASPATGTTSGSA